MRLKFTYLPAPLLFSTNFLLRFFLISKGPYHLDCLTLALNAQKTLQEHTLHYQFGFGYPLTVLLGSGFVFLAKLFSITDPVVAVNFMSVVFSSLSVPILFFLLNNLYGDKRISFLTAIVFSFHPLFLGLSVYGNSHTLSSFFFLTALYFFTKQPDCCRRDIIWGAIALGLMGGSRVQDLVLVAIPIAYLLFTSTCHRQSRPQSKRMPYKTLWTVGMISLSITAAFHLPFFLFKNHSLDYKNQLKIFIETGLFESYQGLLSKGFWESVGEVLLYFSPGGILFFALGAMQMFKEYQREYYFLLLWSVVPLLLYGNLLITVPRYLFLSCIPLIIIFGFSLSFIRSSQKWFKVIFELLFCIVILTSFLRVAPILLIRHTYELLPDWSRYIEQHTPSHAFIIAGDEALFVEHYGHRKTLPRPQEAFIYQSRDLEQFKEKLDILLEKEIPVYITANGLYAYDPQKIFSGFIENNYQLHSIGGQISEDWHRGELELRVGQETLSEIKLKRASQN